MLFILNTESLINKTEIIFFFQFRYTATERAQQSARYFTIGLFDKKDAQGVIFSPAKKIDPVLRVSQSFHIFFYYYRCFILSCIVISCHLLILYSFQAYPTLSCNFSVLQTL